MTFDKLSDSRHKLSWHKAGRENGISPHSLKALNTNNGRKLLEFILLWLSDEHFECPERFGSPLKVLPKKGDLLNPNNWRAIALMDMVSKFV